MLLLAVVIAIWKHMQQQAIQIVYMLNYNHEMKLETKAYGN